MSTEGGTRAIIAALFANAGIAISKFVAFIITGSSSMLAESIHSVADTGNQGLLLLGGRRARREATEQHPFGYGRERYFYAFVVALVLFSIGSLFALYEGIDKLRHPHHLDAPAVALGVLGVAIVLELFSFRTAYIESRKVKPEDVSWAGFIRHAKAPELPVVLLEDTAALLGLVFAFFGVSMTLVTDEPRWDGVGTVAIAVLLAAVAIVLAIEMKSLLIGESATAADVDKIRAALLDGPEISKIIHLRTLHIGPEELLVGAKVAVEHNDTAADIARGIDVAEERVRAAVPIARVIYLEPDLDRGQLRSTAEERE